MRLLGNAADKLLSRFVPQALAFGNDNRCACNDCYCDTNGHWCCVDCWCQNRRCYGPCKI